MEDTLTQNATGNHQIRDIKLNSVTLESNYTPSSPTTSGYSESGSEMENHDSGRVSEMDGSPQINPKNRGNVAGLDKDVLEQFDELEAFLAANKIVMSKPKKHRVSEDYALPVDAYKYSGRHKLKHQSTQSDIDDSDTASMNGKISIEKETLKILLLSLKDARTRLHQVESKLDQFSSSLRNLPHQHNKSLMILTKAVLELSKKQESAGSLSPLEINPNHKTDINKTDSLTRPSTRRQASNNRRHNDPFVTPEYHTIDHVKSRKTPRNTPSRKPHFKQKSPSDHKEEPIYVASTFPRRFKYDLVTKIDNDHYQVPRVTKVDHFSPKSSPTKSPSSVEEENYDNVMSRVEVESKDSVDKTPLYAVVNKKRTKYKQQTSTDNVFATPISSTSMDDIDDEIKTSVSELDEIIKELTTPEPGTPYEIQSPSSTLSRKFPPSSNVDVILANNSVKKVQRSNAIKKSPAKAPRVNQKVPVQHAPLNVPDSNHTSHTVSSYLAYEKRYGSNWHHFEEEISDVSYSTNNDVTKSKKHRGLSEGSIELSCYSTSSGKSADGEHRNKLSSFLNKIKSKSKEALDIIRSEKSTESLSSASGLLQKQALRRNKSIDSALSEKDKYSNFDTVTLSACSSSHYSNNSDLSPPLADKKNHAHYSNDFPSLKPEFRDDSASLGEFDNISSDFSLRNESKPFVNDSIQSSADDVFRVILEDQTKEHDERRRFESGGVDRKVDEPPPKPSRYPHGPVHNRSGSHGNSNGNVPGQYPPGPHGNRSTPLVPPKSHSKIMTTEEVINHEAQEKLLHKQREEADLQEKLERQRRDAEADAIWLSKEERNMNPDLTNNPSHDQSMTRAGSQGSIEAPPPPTVAPQKPPRKPSRPKDKSEASDSKSKFEMVKPSPTMKLDRTDDQVYKDTMSVVKCVLGMNTITMQAKADELFNNVKEVGVTLKKLCTSLELELKKLPEEYHREIDMAQKTTNKDLSQVINQLKLVQRFFHTTQVIDYKKCLMAANQVLAMDAKNLLDVVDKARIATMTQRYNEENQDSSSVSSHEPEETYPTH